MSSREREREKFRKKVRNQKWDSKKSKLSSIWIHFLTHSNQEETECSLIQKESEGNREEGIGSKRKKYRERNRDRERILNVGGQILTSNLI